MQKPEKQEKKLKINKILQKLRVAQTTFKVNYESSILILTPDDVLNKTEMHYTAMKLFEKKHTELAMRKKNIAMQNSPCATI